MPCSRLFPFAPVGRKSGITLPQVLVSMAVAGVLAAILIPSFQSVVRKSSKVTCTNNMRQLHVVFSSYLQDVGHWPQVPEAVTETEAGYGRWWLSTMEPYGAPAKLWRCPIMDKMRISDSVGNPVLVHYIPTQFDLRPTSPKQWPRQPWLIERGNAHGGGSLILFPDGSVQSLSEVLQSQ